VVAWIKRTLSPSSPWPRVCHLRSATHMASAEALYRNLTLVGVKGTPFSLDRVVYETLTALADAARRLAKRKLMLSSTVGVSQDRTYTRLRHRPPHRQGQSLPNYTT
jgi:hypothetical protein